MTVIDSELFEPYVAAFKALSDPVRVQLFAHIASREDEMSCTELVQLAHVGASTVSYHVKILKSAKLISVRKEGRNYFYSLDWDACGDLVPSLLAKLKITRG